MNDRKNAPAINAQTLAEAVPNARLFGDRNAAVRAVCADSRETQPGDLFVAVRGVNADGHRFIPQALKNGAAAVCAETPPEDGPAAWIQAPNTRIAAAQLANAFYQHPAEKLALAGVTGTNGKTSTAYFLKSVFEAAGMPCARIGTTGHEIGGKEIEAKSTTPGPIELARLLNEALQAGEQAAAMEVSSHALEQSRVADTRFDAALFTNLTQDHLDYHGSMEAYAQAKRRLFKQLKPNGTAAVNIDDPSAHLFIETAQSNRDARLIRFGTGENADIRADRIETDAAYTAFDLYIDGKKTARPRLQLLGYVNAMNALAAAAAGRGMRLPTDALIEGIQNVDAIPGRFQAIDEGQPFRVIVDYAHTPDALERLAAAARGMNPAQLIILFGCGGNRDAGKRPLMGGIAARSADLAIVTSDNPRHENPNDIIEQILEGMPKDAAVIAEPDRAEAIRRAVEEAQPNSVVLIAGKGHETYQETEGVRAHFDDRETARESLRNAGYGAAPE